MQTIQKSTPLPCHAVVGRRRGPHGCPDFICPRGAAGNNDHPAREVPQHLHCAAIRR